MLMLRGYESERYAKPIDNSSPEVDGLGILLNFDDFSTYPTVDQIYRYHFDTPVTDADPPPLHYFFVLDYSQSMNYPFAGLNYGDRAKTDGERWKACEQAIEKLQDTASDKDFATLIRFDGGDLDDLGYEPVFGFFLMQILKFYTVKKKRTKCVIKRLYLRCPWYPQTNFRAA